MSYIESNDVETYLLDVLFLSPGIPRFANLPSRQVVLASKISPINSKPVRRLPEKKIYMGKEPQRIGYYINWWIENGDEICYRLPPQQKTFCFLDETVFSHRGFWGIILTDNILIADIMRINRPWNEIEIGMHFLWTSYCIPDGPLSQLDWSGFHDKRIFYYLVKHSGYNWERTFQNAMSVLEMLRPTDGEPIADDVTFVSYENNPNIPTFLSEERFRARFKEVMEEQQYPCKELENTLWHFGRTELKQRRFLLPPLIYGNTLNLLYDGPAHDRTRLLVDLGMAASMGKSFATPFEAPTRKIKVIYIHENLDKYDFSNNLKDSLKKCCSDKIFAQAGNPEENHSPHDVLDANYHLASVDIFKSYPCQNHPSLGDKNPSGYFWYFSFFKPNFSISFFMKIIENMDSSHGDAELVVIDIPELFSCVGSTDEWVGLNWQLIKLRSERTVIINTNAFTKKTLNQVLNLPFDTIFRLQRRISEKADDILLDFNAERTATRIDGRLKKSFSMLLSNIHSKWTLDTRKKYTKKEMLKIIKNKHDMKISDLALILDISASYVKKLRREAGVNASMPQRSPKKPVNPFS